MSLRLLPKASLSEWVTTLLASHRVVGPKAVHPPGQPVTLVTFEDIRTADELVLSYATTIIPPKKVLLPPEEELLRYSGGSYEPVWPPDDRPIVLLGVHTCDMHAIALLDRFFADGYPDQHYEARRRRTTLVSVECLAPCSDHAFCKDMNTLSVPEQFDMHLTDLGEAYAVDVGSEKGEALLAGMTGAREADRADLWHLSRAMSQKWSRFTYRLEAGQDELPGLLAVSARSPLWEDIGGRCLGCGVCTLVCPTCTCFNVVDEVTLDLQGGSRCRQWDSCQFAEFATVTGGHDFRKGRAARLRHRFMRKYRYQPAAMGLTGCVGCGRCATACLVDITPVDVLNRLQRRRVAVTNKRHEVMA